MKQADGSIAAAGAAATFLARPLAPLRSAAARSPSRAFSSSIALACGLGALGAALHEATAATDIVPKISMFASTDDNVVLDEEEAQSASSVLADAEVTFAVYDQRSQFVVTPRVVVENYMNDESSVFDTRDYHLSTSGSRAWSRSAAGFRINYADEIIINSELAEAIPDDPDLLPGEDFTDPDPATGRLTFFDNQRERLEVRGNVDFAVAERNLLRLEVRRQDVAYSGSEDAERSDFDNTAYTLAIIREVNERNTVSARITLSRFQVPSNRNTTDSTLVEGSFSRPIAPTWMAYVTGGVARNQYEFLRAGDLVSNSAASTVLSVGLRKRSQRTRWNFDLSHNTQPWGNGFLAKRDNARIYVNHQFSQRLGGRMGLRFVKTSTLDDVAVEDDRKFTRLDLGFEYALSRTMFLSGGYDFIRQEFINDEDEGEKNTAYFGFTYRGLSRRED